MKDKQALTEAPPNTSGVTRRSFLKAVTGTAAGIGISQVVNPTFIHALEKGLKRHPVVWLQGQGCTGCSVSLLNSTSPPIADVLLKIISLQYHPTVMASEGKDALGNLFAIAKEYKGKFSIAVEGAIPTAENGKYCIVGDYHHKEYSMMALLKELAPQAGSVLAIGTCAAYGGIPAAKGNVTGATGVMDFFKQEGIKTPVVNIPGCPPHPDWIVLSIAHLLEKGIPELLFFGENIHDNCPRLEAYEEGEMSEIISSPKGCRMDLGCKGPDTYADCFERKWNSGLNWCVDNAICIGCVEPGFPDASSPFYEPS